ncbi:MAG: anhydro-N-acetylmuramic acid kinase [Motiliproteus sp.]
MTSNSAAGGYYIGLMSGTSLDGVDAVIVDLSSKPLKLIASNTRPLPIALRQALLTLTQPGDNEIDRLGVADIEFSRYQADIVNQLLLDSRIKPEQIRAIGSHGQTIRHRPSGSTPFTLQIGDPNTLAELAGITVAADFRRRDIAVGGQGAPLVPAFHAQLFRSTEVDRIILNLGGIANVTLLPKDQSAKVLGYDTGPANVLIDSWITHHQARQYDSNGDWAASGNINQALLQQLLQLDYFDQTPPKSTGREQFNLDWIDQQLAIFEQTLSPVDVQATLTELTVQTVASAIKKHRYDHTEIYLCGGGTHNRLLLERLKTELSPFKVDTTQALGLAPDWVEACAFGWLAQRCIERLSGNLPDVTGAHSERILGGLYPA